MSLCKPHHTGLPVGWYLQYTGLRLSKRKHLTVCSSSMFKFWNKTHSTNYTFVQFKLGTPCPMYLITEINISYYLIFWLLSQFDISASFRANTYKFTYILNAQSFFVCHNYSLIYYGFFFYRLEHSFTGFIM